MQRRSFLGATCAAAFLSPAALLASAARAADLATIGRPERFDYATLKGQARALGAAPYRPYTGGLPPAVAGLDWDQYQSLHFKPEHALWAGTGAHARAELFHLGLYFKRPVRMYEVADGQARELAYDPALFDYGKSGLARAHLSSDLGFAGFRLNTDLAPNTDYAAFLGASYFRATSGSRQYGLSARGLAIDTGFARPEEFPDFVSYYLERPHADSSRVVVYGLLDSPSVAGAYRFEITPGDTTRMDIDVALYPRKTIERLGIAPCTSMYQTGENDRRMANDWRPELHDSDGLSMHTGSGEWLWRPLRNPPSLKFSAFADRNPRGFGLLQRDRAFADYQDDGAFYEKRPSLWVEPRGEWGEGAVDLIELPTADETFDNIVAFWNPADKPKPGQESLLAYTLYWCREAPTQSPLGRVVATRTGIGGVVGRPRDHASYRFAIDFAGGDFAILDPKTPVEPVISVSRGQAEITSARPLAAVNGWRAMFDLVPGPGSGPVTMRLFLRAGGQPLTETWLYQWDPPAA
ncbi:MAG: glucan biosynthesis protein D [Burkholderiaceae bacterium]